MGETRERLRVMVLCGHSPRHFYVANALCEAAEVIAIVQETGAEFSWKKTAMRTHDVYEEAKRRF